MDSSETTINELNHDCILHIFNFFTALELMNASKVCKIWEILAKEIWAPYKNVEVSYQINSKSRTKISIQEAEFILEFAGPLIESLELNFHLNKDGDISLIFKKDVSYDYKEFLLEGLFSDQCLIDRIYQFTCNITSAKITHTMSKKWTTMILLANPNLMSLELEDCVLWKTFDENFTVTSVEELSLKFTNYYQAAEFEWCFPNLSELKIEIPIVMEKDKKLYYGINDLQDVNEVLNDLLSQVNPATLKILDLKMETNKGYSTFRCSALQNILKFSNLEHLEIKTLEGKLFFEENFVKNLVESCPELRKIKLGGYENSKPEDTEALLQLSKLENLFVHQLFENVNFEILQYLKKLLIADDRTIENKLDIKMLMEGLNKMPALEILDIYSVFNGTNLEYIFEVIKMAVSQKKNIRIFLHARIEKKSLLQKLIIKRKEEIVDSFKTLQLSVSSRSDITDRIVNFVRQSFPDCLVLRD